MGIASYSASTSRAVAWRPQRASAPAKTARKDRAGSEKTRPSRRKLCDRYAQSLRVKYGARTAARSGSARFGVRQIYDVKRAGCTHFRAALFSATFRRSAVACGRRSRLRRSTGTRVASGDALAYARRPRERAENETRDATRAADATERQTARDIRTGVVRREPLRKPREVPLTSSP